MRRNPAAFAILVGGLIAGTLDLTYAIIFSAIRGRAPQRLLQLVATGWLGNAAYDGGVPTAVLGVVSHYFIMFCAAATFYFASSRIELLRRRPIVGAMLFGIGMYAVMTFIVLPLSAFPYPILPLIPWIVALNLLVHMFLVGVPISLAAKRARA
jgi:hypothetical protein